MAFKPWDDVKLEWDGKSYTIPSNKIMGLIQRLERTEDITAHDMAKAAERGKYAMLASAYACALRYAGLSVTTDEVYCSIFPGGKDAAEKYKLAIVLAHGLISIITPPDAMREIEDMAKDMEGLPQEDIERRIADKIEKDAAEGKAQGRT